ncbi:MAG: amylo-alpha-1,6-glucosidase [Elainella sp.]
MENLDTREWLLTNGLGSFASGTLCDARTRTYHGWLIAALEPPSQRTLLLSHIEASLELDGHWIELGVNFWQSGTVSPRGDAWLQSFQRDPAPTWLWGSAVSGMQAGATSGETARGPFWQLSRRLFLPYSSDPASQRLLIQYAYQGSQPALLKLRPLIADRWFHDQQRADSVQFDQQLHHPSGQAGQASLLLQAKLINGRGIPWRLKWSQGDYKADGLWYWGYRYPEETQRGLTDTEDLYSPGYLLVTLAPGETVTLEASIGPDSGPLEAASFELALLAQSHHQQAWSQTHPSGHLGWMQRRLLAAGDQFVVYRASTDGPTVIAGYPWFNDWGRDSLIALPGLALASGRFDLAKGLLKTFGQHCQQGLIPNAFPDAGAKPFYNSIDAALWWIEALGLYLEASQDWEFLVEQYPVVWNIYKGLMAGTLYSIRVDAFDGLVTWNAPGVALTWMDAVVAEVPVTPRRGKPIEINALWYSALCWAADWASQLQRANLSSFAMDATTLGNQARRYHTQAEQVEASLQKYWNPTAAYLYDTIDPDDYPDRTIRPNAVIALSLKHCGFPQVIGQQVLQVAQQRLLTPYGLRSLDPADPRYIGQYQGGIWQRDRAYHQGTVWPWLLGPFIRAWQRFYPTEPVPFDWQPLLDHFQHQVCLGSISEMFDGDPPHLPRGAIAQAWSVAEVIRHWPGDR